MEDFIFEDINTGDISIINSWHYDTDKRARDFPGPLTFLQG